MSDSDVFGMIFGGFFFFGLFLEILLEYLRRKK